MKVEDIDICIYHGRCPDGLLAAYPIYHLNKNVTLIEGFHGRNVNLSKFENKNVLMVDFCYPENIMIKLKELAKDLFVIDHHSSSLQCLINNNINHIFDIEHSACKLSFDYYLPDLSNHWLVLSVEDRDLFRLDSDPKQVIGAKEVYKCFVLDHMNFEDIESILKQEDGRYYYDTGVCYMGYEDKLIKNAVKYSKLYKFKEFTVRLTNCDFNITSRVGYELAQMPDNDFAIIYYYKPEEDRYYFSCRANPSKEIDLSVICTRFSGGGHKNAAGFSIYGPYSDINGIENLLRGTLRDHFFPI